MSAILRVCQMMGIASKNPGLKIHLFSFLFTFSSLALFCSAASSITQGQPLRDGDTLIYDGFELGFFSPKNSSSRYVGIWYYNISEPSVIWVANRERPIFDKAGILKIGSDGNVVVLDGNNTAVWSSNVSASSNSTAILNDKGNLVLSSSGDTSKKYWQSFVDPTNTFLPGMNVEVNSAKGENRFLTSSE
ncbi:putative G-type lectin S-receptor-like serine/threonine-protein kinase At1g61610 [Prunus avium]|uniref:G-type lectin S-receptor-like serine/threonine-protein kinase At1g61610 n=1 Tax=Prunus avium TaxID=42229 RepID=A0A6P5SEU0_PRUAV|nr:putative G-type lectin S-receptor-like serine/threonine-protein kinase At1g61610 [Prunus avium]